MTAAITIHFKKPKLTRACIDSLLADGWAPVLVWDNSEDAGAGLQELQTRYAAELHVVLAANPRNLGFGKGINAALAALGRYGYTGPCRDQSSFLYGGVEPSRQPCRLLKYLTTDVSQKFSTS